MYTSRTRPYFSAAYRRSSALRGRQRVYQARGRMKGAGLPDTTIQCSGASEASPALPRNVANEQAASCAHTALLNSERLLGCQQQDAQHKCVRFAGSRGGSRRDMVS